MSLTNDEGEPLTAADITQELLDALEERVWTETSEPACRRGCCGYRYFIACSSCGAEEGDYEDTLNYRQHKEGCRLEKLILRAQAFLAAEAELAQHREEKERGEAVPHHPQ